MKVLRFIAAKDARSMHDSSSKVVPLTYQNLVAECQKRKFDAWITTEYEKQVYARMLEMDQQPRQDWLTRLPKSGTGESPNLNTVWDAITSFTDDVVRDIDRRHRSGTVLKLEAQADLILNGYNPNASEVTAEDMPVTQSDILTLLTEMINDKEQEHPYYVMDTELANFFNYVGLKPSYQEDVSLQQAYEIQLSEGTRQLIIYKSGPQTTHNPTQTTRNSAVLVHPIHFITAEHAKRLQDQRVSTLSLVELMKHCRREIPDKEVTTSSILRYLAKMSANKYLPYFIMDDELAKFFNANNIKPPFDEPVSTQHAYILQLSQNKASFSIHKMVDHCNMIYLIASSDQYKLKTHLITTFRDFPEPNKKKDAAMIFGYFQDHMSKGNYYFALTPDTIKVLQDASIIPSLDPNFPDIYSRDYQSGATIFPMRSYTLSFGAGEPRLLPVELPGQYRFLSYVPPITSIKSLPADELPPPRSAAATTLPTKAPPLPAAKTRTEPSKELTKVISSIKGQHYARLHTQFLKQAKLTKANRGQEDNSSILFPTPESQERYLQQVFEYFFTTEVIPQDTANLKLQLLMAEAKDFLTCALFALAPQELHAVYRHYQDLQQPTEAYHSSVQSTSLLFKETSAFWGTNHYKASSTPAMRKLIGFFAAFYPSTYEVISIYYLNGRQQFLSSYHNPLPLTFSRNNVTVSTVLPGIKKQPGTTKRSLPTYHAALLHLENSDSDDNDRAEKLDKLFTSHVTSDLQVATYLGNLKSYFISRYNADHEPLQTDALLIAKYLVEKFAAGHVLIQTINKQKNYSALTDALTFLANHFPITHALVAYSIKRISQTQDINPKGSLGYQKQFPTSSQGDSSLRIQVTFARNIGHLVIDATPKISYYLDSNQHLLPYYIDFKFDGTLVPRRTLRELDDFFLQGLNVLNPTSGDKTTFMQRFTHYFKLKHHHPDYRNTLQLEAIEYLQSVVTNADSFCRRSRVSRLYTAQEGLTQAFQDMLVYILDEFGGDHNCNVIVGQNDGELIKELPGTALSLLNYITNVINCLLAHCKNTRFFQIQTQGLSDPEVLHPYTGVPRNVMETIHEGDGLRLITFNRRH